MIKVKDLVCTCDSCPSQWEGVTDDNRQVYIRYRWGHLTVELGISGDMDEYAAVGGELIFEWESSDSWDGSMSIDILKKLTEKMIEFV